MSRRNKDNDVGTLAMLKYGCNEKNDGLRLIGHERHKLFWGIFIFIRRVPPSNLVVPYEKAICYVDDPNTTDF